MKKLLYILIFTKMSFTEVLYGTANKPFINGASYEVQQAYIEPNSGYRTSEIAENSNVPTKDQQQVIIKSRDKAKDSINFKADNWATNSQVEKMLKKAASDGKLSYVLEQAKKSKLPPTVAIVPIVESNYNKNAVSAKGAGGAWQLMPKTAINYGLRSSERFDFSLSTQVAMQLLHDLYQEFDNWELTFAAYNCGSQCVKNALNNNPKATSIDELTIPKETKDYVHKIIQMNQMVAELADK